MSRRLKSPVYWLLAQQCVQTSIKRNINGPFHWPFVRGIHRWPVDSPHMRSVTWKAFPCDDVIINMGHQSQWSRHVRTWMSNYIGRAHACYLHHTLQWRHNEPYVSNHRRLDCLLDRLFRRRSGKTSKFRVTGLCEGNSPVTGEFPTQRASNAENVSIWWRHHVWNN